MNAIVKIISAAAAALCIGTSCTPAALSGADMKNCSEALVVSDAHGSRAKAVFYVRKDGRWRLAASGKAYIGRNGLGKTGEGDGKTPSGAFTVTSAFGVLPDPGTSLEYLTVTPSTFACDEPGPYYNRIIDTAAVHHSCCGEDMFKTVPAYNYGLTVDFNPENIYPCGSNIFIHCFSGKKYTAGCVALSEKMMKEILLSAHPGMKVLID